MSPFLFAVVVHIVTEFLKEGVSSELLYTDNFVLMNETIKGFWNKFIKWN